MDSYTKTSVTEYLETINLLDPLDPLDSLDSLNSLNSLEQIKLKQMGEWAKQNNEIHLTIECYSKLLNYETEKENICFLHNELGICYMALNQTKLAIQYFENIVTMGANIAEVYNNLVICCGKDKQYKKAESYAMKSLQIEQNDKIYNTIADLYFYMKEYEKSLYFYLKIDDQTSSIKYNMSFPYLAKKIFIRGFELYENRLASNGICQQTQLITRVTIPNIPYWDGLLPCLHLLVIYEQGIGDNILYYRFLLMCAQLYPHMKITYFCKSNVSHLFKNTMNNINIIDDSKCFDLSGYQYKAYIMSLPYLLQVRTISYNVYNYIYIDTNLTKKWKLKLNNDKLKIGFTYKGLLNSFIDKTVPLSHFKSIANMEEVELICLHKDEEIMEDLKDIDFSDNIQHYDIDKYKAFEDTIAILQNIDLLVTIDSAIVHLAGVLNVPTLLLLGYGSDWRWFDCDNCLWFKSIQILRHKENNDLYNIMPHVETFIESKINNNNKVDN